MYMYSLESRRCQCGPEETGVHWCKIDVSVSLETPSIFYTIAALFLYLQLVAMIATLFV